MWSSGDCCWLKCKCTLLLAINVIICPNPWNMWNAFMLGLYFGSYCMTSLWTKHCGLWSFAPSYLNWMACWMVSSHLPFWLTTWWFTWFRRWCVHGGNNAAEICIIIECDLYHGRNKMMPFLAKNSFLTTPRLACIVIVLLVVMLCHGETFTVILLI